MLIYSKSAPGCPLTRRHGVKCAVLDEVGGGLQALRRRSPDDGHPRRVGPPVTAAFNSPWVVASMTMSTHGVVDGDDAGAGGAMVVPPIPTSTTPPLLPSRAPHLLAGALAVTAAGRHFASVGCRVFLMPDWQPPLLTELRVSNW